jgi:hypothetical protein
MEYFQQINGTRVRMVHHSDTTYLYELDDLFDDTMKQRVLSEIRTRCYSKYFPDQPLRPTISTFLLNQIVASLTPDYKKKKITHLMKRRVWEHHVGTRVGMTSCFCCKMSVITQMTFNCGHIVSERNGGETTTDNLLPICQHCNSSMGTMNLYAYQKMSF